MLSSEYILLAKQAIYDMDKNSFAYELLFRTPMGSSAADFGAEIATSQVLVNYCASVAEQCDEIQLPVFINVDSQFVIEYESLPVSPEGMIVELSGAMEPSETLINAVTAWKKLGFIFALDFYDFDAKWDELILLMAYIKVDMLSLEHQFVVDEMAKASKSKCRWIAKRVEDEEVFELCNEAGFEFVQGYFLAKPKPVMGNSIRPGTAVTIKLLKELDRPDITMQEVTALVGQDPKLTVQMIKIINSSLFSLPKPVDDLQSALIYLGVDMLRQWAMMIAFLSNGNVHIEACRLVLLRAKACEMLCKKNSELVGHSSSAFLAGLISGVDILLKVSKNNFIGQVNLSDEVSLAVLDNKGDLGEILGAVCALEHTVSQAPQELENTSTELLDIYQDASQWVADVIKSLKSV